MKKYVLFAAFFCGISSVSLGSNSLEKAEKQLSFGHELKSLDNDLDRNTIIWTGVVGTYPYDVCGQSGTFIGSKDELAEYISFLIATYC